MEKKNYVAPKMKVREIESEQLMAAISQEISDEHAYEGGGAKPNSFHSDDEDDAPVGASNNIWSD